MRKIILVQFACFLIYSKANAQWNVIDVGTTEGLFSVRFINKDTGFICGTNTFLQSFDGGNSWAPVPTVNAFGHALYAMDFPTRKVGYVVGAFIVLKTEDGGLSWVDMTPPDADYLYDVQFLNRDTGTICGDGKEYFKTDDGGNNWQKIIPDIPFGISYEYIQFVSPDTAYLCSTDIGTGTSQLLKSADGGLNWDYAFFLPFSSPTFLPYKVFEFLDSDTGYAGIGGGIFKTTDGGNSWTLTSYTSSCSNIFFSTSDSGYSVGSDSNLTTGIYRTFDGGNTWYRTITPYPDSNYYVIEMFFLNKDYGYAVGSNGLFMKTDNGGGILGTEQPSNDRAFSIFPNPASDEFTLTTSQNGLLTIANEIGQVIQSLTIQERQFKIPSAKFPSGTYILTFQTSTSIQTKKLVVQH